MYTFRELLEIDLEETRNLVFVIKGDYFIGKIWSRNRYDDCIVFGNPETKDSVVIYLNISEELYLYNNDTTDDIAIPDKFEVYKQILN